MSVEGRCQFLAQTIPNALELCPEHRLLHAQRLSACHFRETEGGAHVHATTLAGEAAVLSEGTVASLQQ